MLRVRHRVFLKQMGLNPKNFLLVKEDHESYTFMDRKSKTIFTARY